MRDDKGIGTVAGQRKVGNESEVSGQTAGNGQFTGG